MRRRPQKTASEDDLTFLAGWMYADLFLAMMVVFLATISFVPEYFGNTQENESDTAYNYTQIYKDPMVVVYEGFDGQQIANDIRAFISDKQLDPSAEIIYAQIIGSYNKNLESPAEAIYRAQQFSSKLDMSNFDFLKNASTTLSSTTSVAPSRVVVKFTFAANIGVQKRP
jgi:hypothetical protein